MIVILPLIASKEIKWELDYRGKSQYIQVYKGCTYRIELWGANGGKGCLDGACMDGGVGAYVSGNYAAKVNHEIEIKVGGSGGDGKNKVGTGGFGGWNGGGKGGNDNDITGKDDTAGGGGGSTDLLIKSKRIMVAGAGSGGACGLVGAAGGKLSEHGKINSNNQLFFTTEGSTSNGVGQDGDDSINCPGSGGGGGWMGGLGKGSSSIYHYKSIAYSGSSGYDPSFITEISDKRGIDAPWKKNKNGYAIVKLTNYNDLKCQIPRPTESLTPTLDRTPLLTKELHLKEKRPLLHIGLILLLQFDSFFQQD